MSLIKREKMAVLKRQTIRIEAELLETLTQYAAYMDSSKDHIISEAVRYVIARDREFPGNQNLPQNLPQIPPQNPPQNAYQIVGEIPQGKTAGK